MARKIVHIISDDIDGTENAETVTFSIDGKSYEIDLAERNHNALKEALAPYIKAGRASGSQRVSKPNRSAKRTDLDDVRAWARKTGHKVSDRGRIAQEVLDAYDARDN